MKVEQIFFLIASCYNLLTLISQFRLQTLLNGIITKRSGLSDAELQKLVARKNLYLSAKEARKHGLIDEVI